MQAKQQKGGQQQSVHNSGQQAARGQEGQQSRQTGQVASTTEAQQTGQAASKQHPVQPGILVGSQPAHQHQEAARKQQVQDSDPRIQAADNVIFVGKKPSMSYVMAVMTQLNSAKEIHVRARGQSINKAVDVIEIVRNKFFRDLKYGVTFETASLQNRDNRPVNVSVIDIRVER